MSARVTHHPSRITKYILPLAGLLALAGYFGPWIPHRAAGLVVTGLDLAEYVKFLQPVRSGEIGLWREGFYLPLVAVSVTFSLLAFRPEQRYGWPMRLILLALSAVAALNLLPPAWSPGLLMTPEFRLQTVTLLLCLGLAAVSPFLALLPQRITAAVIFLLGSAGLTLPVVQFLRILPAIEGLYAHAIFPGWGLFVMGLGMAGLAIEAGRMATQNRK